MISAFAPMGCDSAGAFTASYLDVGTGSSVGLVTTVSGLNFGTADPFRWIIATVAMITSSGTFSVTIGGISATELIRYDATFGSRVFAAIYAAQVPTGTSGSVVVTGSLAAPQGTVGVYRVIANSLEATTDGNDALGSGTVATSVTAEAGDFAVAVAIAAASSSGNRPTSLAFTGITENYESAFATTAFGRTGAASTFPASAGTVSATATFSGGSPTGSVIALAAIRPVTS